MKRSYSNTAAERGYVTARDKNGPVSEFFGSDTFSIQVMEQKLPHEIYRKLVGIIYHGKRLDIETANAVAHAMKEWAIAKGATHFSHWFQPMTGQTAEKHDSFIEFNEYGGVLERFSGKQLVQGEPDASSFPSGGIRSTFEARGYTAWDPSSPAFILKRGMGTTLCIPSVFISYFGEALDKKTPLLRASDAINRGSLKLLNILGNTTVTKVYSTLGAEQEYFLIDRDYYYKRPDLVLSGRTIIGAPPPKGQQLEDQYFGSIKERVLSFMHDVEEELFRLGIPAKTRHNEVAPSQFEIAPIFEEANIAVDHNQIVMETLKHVAGKHRLSVLLHEKPFAGVNGSGKHLNWSLSDNNGNNLFTPGNTPQDNIQFLVFLVAAVRAVYHHADILRASIACSGNDHRLGANEAPPAIISVFLGEQLARILTDVENGVISKATNEAIIDLGISTLPTLSKDNTDRNRTSPFAFTGNKFEFRAVGSSQSISFPATVLNTIVAESLDVLADRISSRNKDIKQAAFDVMREEVAVIKPVLFNGDNYSADWEKEAAKRGLPNKKTSSESLRDMVTEKSLSLFEKFRVLSPVELKSRYTIRIERYCKEIDIEAATMINMVQNHVLPSALNYQRIVASSISSLISVTGDTRDAGIQKDMLSKLSRGISGLMTLLDELREKRVKAASIHPEEEQAAFYCNEIKTVMNAVRTKADFLETVLDDELWPFPKFWEILFIS